MLDFEHHRSNHGQPSTIRGLHDPVDMLSVSRRPQELLGSGTLEMDPEVSMLNAGTFDALRWQTFVGSAVLRLAA